MRRRKIAAIGIAVITLTMVTACQKQVNNDNIEETSSDTSSSSVDSEQTDKKEDARDSFDVSESSEQTMNSEIIDDETTDSETTNNAEENENVEDNNTLLPYFLEEPPFSYYCKQPTQSEEVQPIDLIQKSKESNEIIDDEEWFIDNELVYNYYAVAPYGFEMIAEKVLDYIPMVQQDLILTRAFHDDSYLYCTYGGDYSQGYLLYIYNLDTQMEVYALDFSNYRYSPEYVEEDYDYIEQAVRWAVLKDGILYVSNNHQTYAQSSDYMNAYITAIDLTDNSILWRTDALVCNSDNFVIIDDVIISGYGFTDEDDYLYQIDRYNGEVISKTKLKTSPTYFSIKDDTLYLRTYDTNYTYTINVDDSQ